VLPITHLPRSYMQTLAFTHTHAHTGKEANVYHATGGAENADLAIKVYKTSILVFKDRDR